VFTTDLAERPAVFWLWRLPYNLSIKVAFIALLVAHGRRANIALLVLLILLFTIPYWEGGMIATAIAQARDYR
jgi:hypothetical protein